MSHDFLKVIDKLYDKIILPEPTETQHGKCLAEIQKLINTYHALKGLSQLENLTLQEMILLLDLNDADINNKNQQVCAERLDKFKITALNRIYIKLMRHKSIVKSYFLSKKIQNLTNHSIEFELASINAIIRRNQIWGKVKYCIKYLISRSIMMGFVLECLKIIFK